MRRAGTSLFRLIASSRFKPILLLFSLLFCCAYWAVYWFWLVPFLNRASEGTRLRLLFPSHWMQSRIHDHKDPTSTSTTTFGPSPNPYDNWHTSFDFFYSYSSDQDKPPPWPSFPARLFPTLCMCFIVHMWFYNLILRCRGFCWDVWKQCTCKTSNVAPALLGKSMSDQVAPIAPAKLPLKPSTRKARNGPLVGGRSLATFLGWPELSPLRSLP